MKSDRDAPVLAAKRIPFEVFLNQYGRTRATGHRWRRLLPWLDVLNIFGRLYITVASVRRFEEMASRGELAIHMRPPQARGRKGKSARHRHKEKPVRLRGIPKIYKEIPARMQFEDIT